jgi:hypothetical protein
VQAKDVYYDYINENPADQAFLNARYDSMDEARAEVVDNDEEEMSGLESQMSAIPVNQTNAQTYLNLVADYQWYASANAAWAVRAVNSATAATQSNQWVAGDLFARLGVRTLLLEIRGFLQDENSFVASEINRVDVNGGADENTIDNLQSIRNSLQRAVQEINTFLNSL